MVPLLAKMAVEKKCDFKKVTGNYLSDYEFAYACGKIAKILDVTINPQDDLCVIKSELEDKVKSYNPQDEREKVLFGLFPQYVIKNTKDPDIENLVKMGLSEEN